MQSVTSRSLLPCLSLHVSLAAHHHPSLHLPSPPLHHNRHHRRPFLGQQAAAKRFLRHQAAARFSGSSSSRSSRGRLDGVRAEAMEIGQVVTVAVGEGGGQRGGQTAEGEVKKPRGGNIRIDNKEAVLFQAFNWESWKYKGGWYNLLKGDMEDLKKVGFTDIWLPPPSKSVAPQGYMPSQLYNLNDSKYGTEAELQSLIDSCHAHGMRAIADIVINHRCGDFQDSHGNWTIFEGGTPDERLDWGPWAITAGDAPYGGDGKPDTGADFGAAPDIDHTNEVVQRDLANWLLWMKEEVGFDGWRFDFAKGYGGEFAGLYCEKSSPSFAVGEFWTGLGYDGGSVGRNQNHHRKELADWVDATGARAAAFDFTTKGILQQAVEGEYWRLKDERGKPPGFIGYWPSKAVTFVDNHDTGSTQGAWPFPANKVMLGYAYILTHPGIPCVFYDHLYDWKLEDEIATLISARSRNGVNAESNIEIKAAESDVYVAHVNDSRLVVKIGSRFDIGNLAPSNLEYRVCISGKDFCVWERK